MRNVFKQYGLTIITCVVGVLCAIAIGLIFCFEYDYVHSIQGLEEVPARAMESFQYGRKIEMKKEEKTIETNQEIAVNDYFKVWDADGNPGKVQVLQIVGREHEEVGILSERDGKQFMSFQNPGIYTLSLLVSVNHHSEQAVEVDIPVQRALG